MAGGRIFSIVQRCPSIIRRLTPRIPVGIVKVSENGIRTLEDIKCVQDYSIDAVLISESMTRDKKRYLAELAGKKET